MTNLRSLSDLFGAAMKLAAVCAFTTAIAVAVSAQTNTFPTSGNAGIGTTTFDAGTSGLQIQPASRGKFGVLVTDTDGSRSGGLYLDSEGFGHLYLYDSGGTIKVRLAATSHDHTYFNGGGNVGIGTASPNQKLSVAGTGVFYNSTPVTPSGVRGLFMGNFSVGSSIWSYDYANGVGDALFITAQDINLSTYVGGNGINRLHISNSGNVGIGTASPTNLLHVNSGATPSSQIRLSANNAGSLSALSHAPDNAALGFDVDWSTGVGWIARHSTLATLYKIGGKLQVLGWTGATIGSPIPDWTVHTSLDLTTGRLGIGVASPAYKLDVNGEINATGLRINGTPISGGGGSQWSNGTNSIHYNAGNVGLGTGDPAEKLEVAGSVYISGANYLRFPHAYGDANDGKIGNSMFASGLNLVGINNDNTFRKIQLWGQITQNQNDGTNSWAGTNYFSGNVGIGNSSPTEKLHVTGNITVAGTGNITAAGTIEAGNIKAKYQDLAEWVPSSEQLSAGTVVVLDTTKSNQVVSANVAYDTRVAGVISAQPGITLGESGEGKVLVATTGRVRVKVDASRGAIQIGDLLVTSDVLGVAMKSEAVNVGGVQIHRPGTIIGKALEPLGKGSGEILVLLSLQ